jgi:hypothetical protein
MAGWLTTNESKMTHPIAQELNLGAPSRFRYSICTLVNKPDEYSAMLESFVRAGFDPAFCEYLYIDNSAGTKADAFAGYNAFLNAAQGDYIILCHQDILLNQDRIEQLDACIREMDQVDPSWALLGNAGGVGVGEIVSRLTDPSGSHDTGPFPVKVRSLDENFILAKRSANLCLSQDLSGFHLYGTDLCLIAHILGRTAWVINFNLHHKSRGKLDASFFELCKCLMSKYKRVYQGRYIQTTLTVLSVSRSECAYRRALFRQLQMLRKQDQRTGPMLEVEKELMHLLGKRRYVWHWLYYKSTRPFENLRSSVAKRLRRFQRSSPPGSPVAQPATRTTSRRAGL